MDKYCIKTLKQWDTVYTADCVDFCPIDSHRNVLIVGTYQLEESTNDRADNRRLGKLLLFTVDNESLNLCQEITMAGILDARWCPCIVQGKIVLAVATSNGNLLLYSLEKELKLTLLQNINICSPAFALYVDWSSYIHKSVSPSIAVSDSNGSIHVCRLDENKLEVRMSFKAHNFEAWITTFNYWNPSILYTGGDDGKFCSFDLRQVSDEVSKLFSSKEHSAGVTSIQSSLHKENVLFTGSYDENFRVWDLRNMRNSVSVLQLGGGVWRLKNNPSKSDLVLASCMHEGFKIIDVNEHKIVSEYREHQSLAYGADWCHESREETDLVASVSFYDHLLCLWKVTSIK